MTQSHANSTCKAGNLTFREPDHAKYPCMDLAYAAGRAGGTMPAVLNAANQQAVSLFLKGQIRFLEIPRVIEQVCDRHHNDLQAAPSLQDILDVDAWATPSRSGARPLHGP